MNCTESSMRLTRKLKNSIRKELKRRKSHCEVPPAKANEEKSRISTFSKETGGTTISVEDARIPLCKSSSIVRVNERTWAVKELKQ